LANELQRTLGDNLLSVVLYGSSVNGDTTRKFSDIDLFVLLKDTGLTAIKPALPALRTWMKAGNKAPLLFSAGQFERAADVFAIEFSDIKDRRRVLVGTDPFQDIAIDRAALRRQLEFELRVNLLRLRRHYLEAGETPKMMGDIMAQALSTLSTLFRATLRLLGQNAPAVKKETWRALNGHVPIDVAALEKIWDLRADGARLDQKSADALFERLTQTVESVIQFVDGLN
jgi:predicted nucleotidyltransferase